MRIVIARHLAMPLAWAGGAISLSAAWVLVNVYVLGNADHAYGSSGSLALQLLVAGLLLVPGFAGCLVSASVRSTSPKPLTSFLAGAGFVLALRLFLAALGLVSPGEVQSALLLTAAFLLGALSFAGAPANVA